MAERGLVCWALNIKTLLNNLVLSYLWRFQSTIHSDDINMIQKLLKSRLRDTSYSDQLERAKLLKSTSHLESVCSATRKIIAFDHVDSKSLSRNLAKYALKCPGNMLDRIGSLKLCSACD